MVLTASTSGPRHNFGGSSTNCAACRPICTSVLAAQHIVQARHSASQLAYGLDYVRRLQRTTRYLAYEPRLVNALLRTGPSAWNNYQGASVRNLTALFQQPLKSHF